QVQVLPDAPLFGDLTQLPMRCFHCARICAVVLMFLAGVSLRAAEITVFAAASLTDALKAVAANYEKISNDRVVFNFAASGTLARQIEAGAPADVFFSADEARMNDVEKRSLLVKGSRTNLLGNALVIVTALDAPAIHSPAELTNAAVARLAIGDPKVVPAGTYAKVYLERLQLWPVLRSRIIPCANVRAVLAAVESGNVDAGFVYKTDAAISRNVMISYEVPLKDGPQINYPLALVKDGPQLGAAKKFMSYLDSDAAGTVFKRFGFNLLSPVPPQ
ncbi:MAG TPA: molybdate ABC transporter substrate-binding protein, partial [Candidatus Binatia bacterium]|nr:molybdate ABC transporter substrate-binding protein [Candidatus Binatia bacterium]